MDFNGAMANGMVEAEGVWGDSFTLDGNEATYIGTFNSWKSAQQIGPGGYEQQIDGIMVASKDQFGTSQPKNGQRMTLGGRRYVIVEPEEDSASWTMALKGINE